MNKLQRFNITRPFVEGVHTKRYNSEFLAWFEEHKGDYADWFVKKEYRRETHVVWLLRFMSGSKPLKIIITNGGK